MDASTIAVIGMAGRFPGAADLRTFWRNLAAGVESVRYFTDEELRAAGESEQAIADPSYVKACARLDGIEMFDAGFFGMSPRDASIFDPQHRLFLECAWEAFEHAGYVGEAVEGPVAVFGSCGMSEYMVKNVMTNPEVMTTVGEWLVRHTGNDPNFLATRVSYELNLRGPSMNVQTACSSSLVAIHLACQSLLNGECDLALAGGSTISAEQDKGYFFKEGEIFSADGHTRTFDARSSGTTVGSATGCVVLKRLADAERDGDHVLAVIRGSAINNDGDDKVGYLAPSVSGQARVVTEALAVAGTSPEDITYIEAHGTATRMGDPIEIAGLTQAFRASTDRKQYCAIGSLKSNIGHAGEAAGIAGFVKIVLALENRQIPPSLHYESPNPQCDFPSSPFFVNTKLRPWEAQPRVAGITGLGAGGTNCHVILEGAPARSASGPSRGHQLLVVSAKTATALETATENLARHLADNPGASLADVAYTLAVGRKAFRHRRAIVARDARHAVDAIAAKDPRGVSTQHDAHEPRGVAFLFPGGGAQYPGMARELYDTEPVFREAVDACLAFIQPRLKSDLRALMFPAPGDAEKAGAKLEEPSLTLPALFTIEYAMARLLLSWGVTPTALLGHSAGEYAAACVAGVLSFEDALALVATRGRLFETVAPGGMVAVELSAEAVRPLLGAELSVAAVNAPELCVVSGPTAALEALEAELRAREVEHQRVHIHVAAHSAMLGPILAEFRAFCRTIRFEKPRIPFVSNLTGTWITDTQATDPDYWVDHLRSTVRFDEGLRTLLDGAERVLVEVGPGRTLSSLARQQPKRPTVTATMRHPKEEAADVAFLLAAVGRVWTAGGAADWARLYERQTRQRVPLPTYPWERQRYWLAPGKAAAKKNPAGLRKRSDLAEWFYAPSWRRALVPAQDTAGKGPWLVLTGGSSLDGPLAEALRTSGDTVVTAAVGPRFARVGDHAYTVAPGRAEDFEALVGDLRTRGLLPRRVVHLLALTARRSPLRALVRSVFEPPMRAVARPARAQGPLGSYDDDQARAFGSQAFLAQALGREVEALHWAVVTEGVQRVGDDGPAHPERATALGVPRVIGREREHMTGVAIDVVVPPEASAEHARLVDRLARELRAGSGDPVVAYRGGDRFVERFDPLHLAPATTDWVRRGGIVLVTGGLGGIGLTVAEHVARAARGARLVLVGRTRLPEESRWDDVLARLAPDDPLARRIRSVRALRALGAEVLVANADVTDLAAVEALAADVRARFGAVDTILHAAGLVEDALLALRKRTATSPVLDTKVKGALVLDAVFGDEVETLVLFSSVSSILGLAGQADYGAANAFLDAFAHARRRRGVGRTVSINWNAWQEVGLAAGLARASRQRGAGAAVPGPASTLPSSHPLLEDVLRDDALGSEFRTRFDRARHWLVGEHVVKGGDALIPGTGYLELARAAVEHRRQDRPVELRDVVFLSPFVVGPGEARALHVRVARGERTSDIVFYGDSEDAPHATARGAYVDSPAPARVDLDVIRARCTLRSETIGGFVDQPFMAFGARWANVERIDHGAGEALIALALDDAFSGDVGTYRLHPALLDMATGAAQKLIPGVDLAASFYVPFSYARVLVRRALPGRLFSHVRLVSSGKDTATFDVTLLDAAGDEVADIEGFTMRKIADPSVIGSLAPRAVRPWRETPLEAALREGMLPREGVDALDRILAADASPQVVASSVDLHAWFDDLAAAKASAGGAGAGDNEAPTFERPELSTSFLAPRTSVERELAAMWRELLGVAQVGVRDDFFELGGQSLIAVRLFARIRKKYGTDLPLSTLFEAPTIEGCAAILGATLGLDPTVEPPAGDPARAQANGETAATSPGAPHVPQRRLQALVPIQRGDGRTAFFCVHGAGGNVLNFRDLSRAMGGQQPFYGLQARGIDGVLRPHDSIEAMAAAYLDEIRALQPRGPYILGGYSGGGVVALEMARRITEAGERVALLAFIDTFHPQMPLRDVTMARRLGRMRDEGLGYLREAVERRLRHRRERRELDEIDRRLACGEPIPEDLRDRHLTRNFEQIAARHRPRPWNGRALLFRADEVEYIFGDASPSYGWDAVIAEVEIVRVPGNHANLLLEPNASILTRALGRAIEEAHRGPRAGNLARSQAKARSGTKS